MSTATDARAALLRQRLSGRGPARVIPARPDGPPPLSFAQERLWFMDQLAPESAAYQVPFPVRLGGPLDVARLEEALDRVVARHEALRMRFPASADGRPTVVVEESVTVPLEIRVLDPALEPDRREALARDMLAVAAATPFDLATGPLLRAVLIRVSDQEHLLFLAVHHIVFDGWSIDVFLRDLFAAYGGEQDGPTPTRYGDYAAWQRDRYQGERAARDLAYWREHLAGVPPLDLPLDRARPPEQSFRGEGHPVRMDGDVARGLAELAREHGVTAYTVLMAAYQVLLARHSGQDDFAIGSTVAGRSLPELERTVGLFANVLALRADLSGNPTFAHLLDRVRATVLDGFAHEEGQFDQIVSELRLPRDISRSPVFQATFTLLNYAQAETAPHGLRVSGTFADNRVTRFDLELYLYAPQDEISGFFTYNADIFDAATIGRLGRHLERVLRAVIADPQVRVGDLDLLDPAERDLVLHGWNSTEAEIGPPRTLPAMVAAQVARTPDAVAVAYEDTILTYRELGQRADALARQLRAAGARAGGVVAVCAPRCPELVVALLAVVQTGAAYLPLDPQYPAERLAFLLDDADVRIVAVHGPAADKLPDAGLTVIRLDGPQERVDGPGDGGPDVDDVAYVIYTSGSTGRPKGVLNTHRGIHNRLDWMQRTYQLGADDVVLQKTPTGFDVSVWEFFWPLAVGARLVLARPGGERDAAYLRDAIIGHGVTTLHFVPSMLSVFLAETGIEACTSLRRVICSGEELPVQVARAALDRLGCELHNLYGPTEAAIDVSSWQCRADELGGLARVPIGRPIQNIRLYILDTARRPVPPGLPGELFIAGVGVAKGYLNRPELTAQRFLPDPFGPPGSRMYATGDRARHRDDGAIEYLGRLDNQVKVRGVRIELGEIESVLRDQPGIREAAVVVREDRPGDQRLTGYLVGQVPEPEKLRAALKQTLPDYLVPAAFVVLPALPVTPNGKLDRRALPAPTSNRDPAATTPPGTDVEKAIAAVWSAVLGQDGIGIDDDFFDLGGHSLLATQVVARLRTALPEDCARASVMDLFKNKTIRELAALVSVPAAQRGPRLLLHELTRPVPAAQRTATLVCIPYGGGSAVVYQPLADVLPAGYRLFALAIPGHDVGLDEQHREFGDLAQACVAEILARIEGPVAVYGHCGVGGALAVAVSTGLERAGRPVQAVFAGAILPFARPRGLVTAVRTRLERLRSDRAYTNWLTSLGVDLSDLEPAQVRTLIQSMRADSESAEDYFTGLMAGEPTRLAAPVVSVVGERDDMTGYYQERYREWHFLADTSALVVLDEAGHYFLKHRATELATILTGVLSSAAAGELVPTPAEPDALAAPGLSRAPIPAGSEAPQGIAGMPRRRRDATWWLHEVSRSAGIPLPDGPRPSMRRFLAVAAGQLASMAGSAMTEFAVPIWIYLHTHSLVRMALFSAVALVPGIVVLPFAGAVVDRYSRRAVMLAGDCAAGVVQACFLALVLSDRLRIGHLYVLLAALSVALTFQRLAYSSAVPQLVPKRYLGHANGVVQTASGVAQFLVPVVAAGLLATVGLGGIIGLDVASYTIVILVVAVTRFPPLLADKRRESVAAEIRTGFRYALRRRGFPAMLVFFAATNVFLGPLFIMVQPLVLGFGTLATVTKVAVAAALGGTAGGLLMAVWGGPAKRRIAGMLSAALVIDAAAVVAGLRPALATVALGVFGMAFGLTVMNAIYATIVQVKVPARYHGRVFAVHTLFAWCTLPVGFVALGPLVSDRLQPLVSPGGALAGSVGQVVGVGPGRGIALTYLVFAVAMAVIAVLAWRYPSLRTFDRDVPDAEPDDLIGLNELRRRRAGVADDGKEQPHDTRTVAA